MPLRYACTVFLPLCMCSFLFGALTFKSYSNFARINRVLDVLAYEENPGNFNLVGHWEYHRIASYWQYEKRNSEGLPDREEILSGAPQLEHALTWFDFRSDGTLETRLPDGTHAHGCWEVIQQYGRVMWVKITSKDGTAWTGDTIIWHDQDLIEMVFSSTPEFDPIVFRKTS